MDATNGGTAHLHKCNVGWGLVLPIRFLFGGKPHIFNNPYNVYGTVSCIECTTNDQSKKKSSWWKISSSRNFMASPGNKGRLFGDGAASSTIELTIANVSEAIWSIKFKPDVGMIFFHGAILASPTDVDLLESCELLIKPLGGKITVKINNDGGKAKQICGTLPFIDRNSEEYRHVNNGSDLTDLTIVCPTICAVDGRRLSMSSPTSTSKGEPRYKYTSSDQVLKEESEKRFVVVAVGRFGSGNSTFLNTLAGVHWKVADGIFVVMSKKVEMFETSRDVKGCTVRAGSKELSTFDGQELTVIDTVGYEDSFNAEAFYSTSNLTEVINQFNEISAVVIVVNARDPRLTQGFLESLFCVPKSFKKMIQKNVILVFTNWNDDDEDQYGSQPYRGFTEQVKIIRKALGFEADDGDVKIPAFWMDNRPFNRFSENAQRTVQNLSGFIDCVESMSKLSCKEFKEMRALSQFERIVRKSLREYFEQSNGNLECPSGYEKFLFDCAHRHAPLIKKVTWDSMTAKDWSDKLVCELKQDIVNELPNEMKKICEELDKLTGLSKSIGAKGESAGGSFAKRLMDGGLYLIGIAVIPTLGLSLVALPVCLALAYAHSKTWSREKVLRRVVFEMSAETSRDLCLQFTDQVTSHVDNMVQQLQACFAV